MERIVLLCGISFPSIKDNIKAKIMSKIMWTHKVKKVQKSKYVLQKVGHDFPN